LGVKQPGREDDHSPPSNVENKTTVGLYFCSLIRRQGVKPRNKSTFILFYPNIIVFSRPMEITERAEELQKRYTTQEPHTAV
jgi:hypothetical protein